MNYNGLNIINLGLNEPDNPEVKVIQYQLEFHSRKLFNFNFGQDADTNID